MFNRSTIMISFVLTASFILLGILTGCGSQPAEEAPASEPAPAQALPTADLQLAPTETASPVSTEVPAEAPTEAAAPAGGATVSFATDVMPIIQSRCINCHGGDRIEEGLLMRSYEEIMAGSENGPVIVPGDAANSKLVELVTSQKMPKRGPKLTPPQVQVITEWVAAGAPNN